MLLHESDQAGWIHGIWQEIDLLCISVFVDLRIFVFVFLNFYHTKVVDYMVMDSQSKFGQYGEVDIDFRLKNPPKIELFRFSG